MSTGLFPCGNKILVKEQKAEKKQQSTGIYIPEEKKNLISGTILSVGPGSYSEAGHLIPMHFKTGEAVLFRKHSGEKYNHNGEEYIIISAHDILCKIEN
jgi:chaperonin GroES